MQARRRSSAQPWAAPVRHLWVLTLLLPLLLYVRVVGFDYVRADDVDLIARQQPFLGDLANAPRAFGRSYFAADEDHGAGTYYRPMAVVSFMLDAHWSGSDPRGYHLTNVLLHALVCLLLMILATEWGASPRGALAAALLFAAHPGNVHAVAWIAARNELLLAGCGLLSLIAWSRARPGHQRAGWWIGLHVLMVAAALFTKETGIVFPALAMLQQRLVLGAPASRAQRIGLMGDAAAIAVWAALRAEALAGASSPAASEMIRTVLLNSPQLLVQTGKLLLPVRLNVTPGVDYTGLAIGALAFGTLAWIARRIDRRAVLLAVGWWAAFLVPPLLVPGLPAYEHRNYLPLAGLLLALSVGVSGHSTHSSVQRTGTRRQRAPRLGPLPLTLAVGVVVCAFTLGSVARQGVYRDGFAFWTDASGDAQYATFAHVNLGQLYEEAGQLATAEREYRRALAIDPLTPKAHNNLGVVMMKLNQPEAAVAHFTEEVRLHPANAEAWFNLGLAAERRGDQVEARRHYERAIRENSRLEPALEKLGRLSSGR